MSGFDGLIQLLPRGEQAQLAASFKRLEDGAASSLAISTPGATGGAKIRRLVVDGDLMVPAGKIIIGPVAPTKGNVLIDTDGIRLRNYTTNKINLTTGGDVMIGSDLSQPGFTYLSIFSIQQNYNSENFLAGDMLIGDNSASKANIKWDKANGVLKLRGGTAATMFLDTSGILTITNGAAAISFQNTSAGNGGFIDFDNSNRFVISNKVTSKGIFLGVTLTDATQPSLSWGEDAGQVNRTQLTLNTGVQGTKLVLADATALPDTVIQTAGTSGGTTQATFPGAVNVGTGSSTTAGNLTVSGAANITGAIIGSAAVSGTDGTFTGGLNVGSATGAVAGEILTSLTGTWTPTYVGSGTAGVFTYTNQIGYYVKIGGLVFIEARVTISAIGTPPVGVMSIGGLPFASAATYLTGVTFSRINQFNYTAAALQLIGLINAASSVISLAESFDNIAQVSVPAANFTNAACDLVISGFYKY